VALNCLRVWLRSCAPNSALRLEPHNTATNEAMRDPVLFDALWQTCSQSLIWIINETIYTHTEHCQCTSECCCNLSKLLFPLGCRHSEKLRVCDQLRATQSMEESSGLNAIGLFGPANATVGLLSLPLQLSPSPFSIATEHWADCSYFNLFKSRLMRIHDKSTLSALASVRLSATWF